jgi:hypothetical protein
MHARSGCCCRSPATPAPSTTQSTAPAPTPASELPLTTSAPIALFSGVGWTLAGLRATLLAAPAGRIVVVAAAATNGSCAALLATPVAVHGGGGCAAVGSRHAVAAVGVVGLEEMT